MVLISVLSVIAVLSPFLAWCVYWCFCAWLVNQTKDPKALDHAATAAKAFSFRPLRGRENRLTRSSSKKPPALEQ